METNKSEWFGRLGSLFIPPFVMIALMAATSGTPANGASSPGNTASAQLQIEGGKAFPVLSCSLGVTADTSWTKGGGASVGKPNPEAIRFTKAVDADSILLLKAITTGKAFTSVKFTATAGTGNRTTTIVYELTGVFVTAITHVGTGGTPLEEVSFVYKTLAWKFTDANGVETSGVWDIPAGTFN
jgi:type VI secretion system secreted protein Hcp